MPATSTVPEEFALLVGCLVEVTDPRFSRGKGHPLPGVLALVVLGLMAGCRSLSAISRYGQSHPEVLPPLGLRRSPSVATLHRLLRLVAGEEVRTALLTFTRQVHQRRTAGAEVGIVAVDGKTLRGVWEAGEQLHVLHVFAQTTRLALDQVAVNSLRDEVAATQDWLTTVAKTFPWLAILTADALYADENLCAAVVAGGGDYVLRLKKNQGTLLADTVLLFATEPGPPDAVSVSAGHGRRERREVRVSSMLCDYSPMPGLRQVAEVTSRVERSQTGHVRAQRRYLFTSLGPEQVSPRRLLALSRGHWGIENRLFHVTDDSFGEDRHVLQSHAAGALLRLLRATGLNLLRGVCPLWTVATPLTARAEWVNGHPSAILAAL